MEELRDLLWNRLLVFLLLGTGLYFTVRLRLIQVRRFTYMFRVLAGSRRHRDTTVSSFQALATSLAARVGTGNLAGVALAITLGGPGAVFWMWIVAMLGMSTTFVESTLAQVFKIPDGRGGYRGGPAYYMERGLGKRWMGQIFAITLIIAFGLVFVAVQAHTIADALHTAFAMPQLLSGACLVALTALIIFGGIPAIARFAEVVVPFMAIGYLLLALFVVARNLEHLPSVFALIVSSAFGAHQAVAGGLGYTVAQAASNGIRRGLFSNEAGLGSAPNAAATAEPQPPHPASQGYVQMLGVFIDTLVICSCTAAIILLSVDLTPGEGPTGITLTQTALASQVGDWARLFVAVAVFLFAFTSIVADYAYAELNLVFLKDDLRAIRVYRVVALGMVLFGALAELPVVWTLADVSMGLMALVNLVAILMLSGLALRVARHFENQLAAGKVPRFTAGSVPGLDGRVHPEAWPTVEADETR